MVGFTLLSRSYYYLRRRSPGPPFPPDHRQAGERGAITFAFRATLQQKSDATQRDDFKGHIISGRVLAKSHTQKHTYIPYARTVYLNVSLNQMKINSHRLPFSHR